MSHEELVGAYFAAMRRGADAEDEMMALFDRDAVYVEPFSGSNRPAVGRDEVRQRLRQGWEQPLPEMELDVLAIEIDGDTATRSADHLRYQARCEAPTATSSSTEESRGSK